jgi:hypothetical protein
MDLASPDAESKIQKLRLAIQKGNAYVDQLRKKGIDTVSIQGKLEDALTELDRGEISRAYSLVQEYISEMNGIKKRIQEGRDAVESAPVTQKKGKGVYALIRDDGNERKKMVEWRNRVSNWREMGYDFESDDKLFKHSLNDIDKRMASLQHQIDRGEEIRRRVEKMREDFQPLGKAYKQKLDDVERAILRLDRIDDIDRRLNALVNTFKSVEGRFKALRNRISRYRRRGLKTSYLEEMLEHDEDLDYLDKQFDIYEGNIEFLIKEKNKLKDIRSHPMASDFEREIREIEDIIDDPWKLDSIVEMTLDLEKSLREAGVKERKKEDEKKRRDEIRENLERYRGEGYKVYMVEQLLDDDMNLLEEEFDQLIRNIAKLKSLKEKLFKLNAMGFEEDVAAISQKMNDPSNLMIVDRELDELKNRIVNHRSRIMKMESSIKRWAGMGYSVSKLQDMIQTDISGAEELFEKYEDGIAELSRIESEIKEVKHREISDQIHKLMLKIKNPELVDTVRKEYEKLKTQIEGLEEIKERRKDLNGLLKEWKNQGYTVEKILRKMKEETTIEGIEEIILNYTRAVASLKSVKAEFPAEERSWFKNEEDFIRDNLGNLDMAREVVNTFEKLKEKNQNEERVRGQIARKLQKLREKGIDTSRVEKLLSGGSEELQNEYNNFLDLTKRLLKLKAKLLRESHRTSNKVAEDLARSMNDPYRLDEYEMGLTGKIGSTEENGAVDAEIPESYLEKMDVDTLKDMAKKAYKENNLLDALGMFEAILAVKPDHKESNFYRKKVLMKLKKKGFSSPQKNPPSPERVKKQDTQKKEPIPESAKNKPSTGCVSCGGTGKCSWCDGTGKCSTCGGTGKYFGDTCSTCKGTGRCSVCDGTGKCSWCSK